MRRAISLAIVSLLLALSARAQAAPLQVEAVNASTPTRCAETDNIYVRLISPHVQRFTLEARHPAYLSAMTADDKVPDFGNCGASRDPVFRFAPREVTLYEDAHWQLRGFTYSTFWRRPKVPVRVGKYVETGLHLLQLWTRGRERDEEVLVLYPADGYWRARPLAPAKLGWQPDPLLPTAYGASFLVGPVGQQRRPLVDIREVVFDPGEGAFRLKFTRGGGATVKVAALTEERISLDVALTRSMPLMPFAALRSMFAAPDNADTAEVSWRDIKGASHIATPVMKFRRANVSELWAGRSRPSRHNTSAPDLIFGGFQ
jgi:hypothetical protein